MFTQGESNFFLPFIGFIHPVSSKWPFPVDSTRDEDQASDRANKRSNEEGGKRTKPRGQTALPKTTTGTKVLEHSLLFRLSNTRTHSLTSSSRVYPLGSNFKVVFILFF